MDGFLPRRCCESNSGSRSLFKGWSRSSMKSGKVTDILVIAPRPAPVWTGRGCSFPAFLKIPIKTCLTNAERVTRPEGCRQNRQDWHSVLKIGASIKVKRICPLDGKPDLADLPWIGRSNASNANSGLHRLSSEKSEKPNLPESSLGTVFLRE